MVVERWRQLGHNCESGENEDSEPPRRQMRLGAPNSPPSQQPDAVPPHCDGGEPQSSDHDTCQSGGKRRPAEVQNAAEEEDAGEPQGGTDRPRAVRQPGEATRQPPPAVEGECHHRDTCRPENERGRNGEQVVGSHI
jgi:hypothetical protein